MRIRHIILAAAVFAVAIPSHASALAGDPVVTVTAPATVQAGQTITFHVTIDQPGFAPSNGSQKIMARFGTRTNNWANYTVIPMTVNPAGGWDFTYVADTAAVSANYLIFSVTVPVSTARIPRTVGGTAYFTVTA